MRAREIPYAYRICADVGRLRKNILETFNVSLRASAASLHKLPTASCAVYANPGKNPPRRRLRTRAYIKREKTSYARRLVI